MNANNGPAIKGVAESNVAKPGAFIACCKNVFLLIQKGATSFFKLNKSKKCINQKNNSQNKRNYFDDEEEGAEEFQDRLFAEIGGPILCVIGVVGVFLCIVYLFFKLFYSGINNEPEPNQIKEYEEYKQEWKNDQIYLYFDTMQLWFCCDNKGINSNNIDPQRIFNMVKIVFTMKTLLNPLFSNVGIFTHNIFLLL